MIYECALVAKADLPEEKVNELVQVVKGALSENDGEMFLEDDWGKVTFAQPTANGDKRGHFYYFIYRGNAETNKELNRRFGINEGVLRSMTISLGEDSEKEAILKAFKSPYSKVSKGSVTDTPSEDGQTSDMEKDRKKFAKRKTCWFTAKRIKADWKDPATFSWLINEFGKISPARVSGVSKKHQRFATTAIKRARQIGVASNISGRIAE